jgi:hypothetical protein
MAPPYDAPTTAAVSMPRWSSRATTSSASHHEDAGAGVSP